MIISQYEWYVCNMPAIFQEALIYNGEVIERFLRFYLGNPEGKLKRLLHAFRKIQYPSNDFSVLSKAGLNHQIL